MLFVETWNMQIKINILINMVGHVWVLIVLPRVTTPKQNFKHLINYHDHEPLGIAVPRMLL